MNESALEMLQAMLIELTLQLNRIAAALELLQKHVESLDEKL